MLEKIDKWMVLAIGLVGGWVISTVPGWMHASSYEDWWGIATAVATTGAVVVALWVSASERRERRRKDVMRATLLAPRVAIRIAGVRTEFSTFYAQWSSTPDCFMDPLICAHAANWADRARNEFLMPELETLASSPTRCAAHLVNALSFIDIFHGLLSRIHEDPEKQKAMLAAALPNARCAIESLEAARKDCLTWKEWR